MLPEIKSRFSVFTKYGKWSEHMDKVEKYHGRKELDSWLKIQQKRQEIPQNLPKSVTK